MDIEIKPLADTGVQLVFGREISEDTNQKIRMFIDQLEKNPIEGLVEWVPAYTTLTIFYRPDIILYQELCQRLNEISEQLKGEAESSASLIF